MTEGNGDRSLRSVAVVIAAAGRGERFGGEFPKALERIGGRTLLEHCLDAVAALPGLGAIVVSAPPTHVAEVVALCEHVDLAGLTVVVGGETRTDSVGSALAVLPPEIDVVLVHDAARAFTPMGQFLAVVGAVWDGDDAVVPGVPVVDTIKEVNAAGGVVRTVDRGVLRAVQTPQGFDRAVLDEVHANSSLAGLTDDAAMVELTGGRVQVIPGDVDAFKVTTPFDRLVAEALLVKRQSAKSAQSPNQPEASER